MYMQRLELLKHLYGGSSYCWESNPDSFSFSAFVTVEMIMFGFIIYSVDLHGRIILCMQTV